jgi:hypothetical protein
MFLPQWIIMYDTTSNIIRKNWNAHQCYVIRNLPNLFMYSCIIIQLVYYYDSRREETRIFGTGYRTTSTDYARVSPIYAYRTA